MSLSHTSEWTVFDSETQELRFVRADSQKEAVRKAFRRFGVLARHTNDARPRTGDAELMGVGEFREWLDNTFKS